MADPGGCTHAALLDFSRGSLLKATHMEALCHGNMSTAQAKQLIEDAAKSLGSKPLGISQLPVPRLLMLPDDAEVRPRAPTAQRPTAQRPHGAAPPRRSPPTAQPPTAPSPDPSAACVRGAPSLHARAAPRARAPPQVVLRLHPSLHSEEHQPLLNLDERNSAIELTLQAGVDARPDTIIVELLAQVLGHPAYERLRTIEQLGYIVNLGMRDDLGVVGLRVIVQSASKHAAQLDERIEAFLATVPALLSGLSASEFSNHRESLLTAKLEQPKTLRHETGIYWGEISQGTYDFTRDKADAEVLRSLTVDDLANYWRATFDAAAPRRRKLSSQAFAAHHPLPPKQATGVHGRKMHYVEGLEEVIRYKRTLAAFPAPRRADKQAS